MNKQLFWLALNIYFEARNQSHAGKVAVGHVVLNRVINNDTPVEDVVLKPWQFSWANDWIVRGLKPPSIKEYKALWECICAAEDCVNEVLEGKDLFGATHYHAADMKEYPYWSKVYKKVIQVDDHIFYKER